MRNRSIGLKNKWITQDSPKTKQAGSLYYGRAATMLILFYPLPTTQQESRPANQVTPLPTHKKTHPENINWNLEVTRIKIIVSRDQVRITVQASSTSTAYIWDFY